MLGLFGCGKRTYRVDYHGSRSSFTGAKDSYAAGTEVVLYYDLIATDTDYSFRLDGEPLNPGYDGEKGYVIRFTMPAHDVSLTVEWRNTMEYVPETPEETDPFVPKPRAQLVLEVAGRTFYPQPEENASAEAFLKKLEEGPLTVEMHDYGGFEKVGNLPWSLPRSDERITTVPGDIILYQGTQITVYYGQNTWNFTRLAKIPDASGLAGVLGMGGVTAVFRLEWDE